MPTVPRGPLISPERLEPPKAQDFTSPGLAQRLEGPFPFRQRDFPTAPPKRLPKAQEFISAGLAQRLEGPYPLRMRDFPLPKGRDVTRSRDYLFVNELAALYERRPPFQPTDWELPNPRVPITRETPQPNFLVAQRSVFPDFRQTDFPLTARPVLTRARDYLFVNQIAVIYESVPPLRMRDWPLPQRRDSPRARDWQSGPDVALLSQQLFGQYSWPLPARLRLTAKETPAVNTVPFGAAIPGQYDWPLAKRAPLAGKDSFFVNTVPIGVVPAVDPSVRQYDWPLASTRPPGVPDVQFLNPSVYYPVEEFRAKGWIEPRHRPNNPDGPNARKRREQAEQELADAISRLARQQPKPAPAAFRVKGIPSGSEVFAPGLAIVLPPPKPAKAKRVRTKVAKPIVEAKPAVQAPPRVEVSVLMLHPPGIESLAAVGRPVIHDHERDAMDALLAIERLLAHRP